MRHTNGFLVFVVVTAVVAVPTLLLGVSFNGSAPVHSQAYAYGPAFGRQLIGYTVGRTGEHPWSRDQNARFADLCVGLDIRMDAAILGIGLRSQAPPILIERDALRNLLS